MNHNNIVAGLQQFITPINTVRALSPGTELVLGEVGSALNPGNQDYIFEGVFGDALWTVDYLLYALTMVRYLSLTFPLFRLILNIAWK